MVSVDSKNSKTSYSETQTFIDFYFYHFSSLFTLSQFHSSFKLLYSNHFLVAIENNFHSTKNRCLTDKISLLITFKASLFKPPTFQKKQNKTKQAFGKFFPIQSFKAITSIRTGYVPLHTKYLKVQVIPMHPKLKNRSIQSF